jgi:hypothetical protein
MLALIDILRICIRLHALHPSITPLSIINHTPPPIHPLRLTKQLTPRTLIIIHPNRHPLLALTTPPPRQTHQAAPDPLRQKLVHLRRIVIRLEQVLIVLIAVVVLDLVQPEGLRPLGARVRRGRSARLVVAVLVARVLVGELEVPLELRVAGKGVDGAARDAAGVAALAISAAQLEFAHCLRRMGRGG